ncbi:hypothetical protein L7F22_006354 [Adiantum nelumboides]|nr:hypothetical protein [Adiantum nelumboides]
MPRILSESIELSNSFCHFVQDNGVMEGEEQTRAFETSKAERGGLQEPLLDRADDSSGEALATVGEVPPWSEQITIRGIIVSTIIGAVFCIITHKLNLTVGVIPSLNVAAGLLGFFFIKSWISVSSKLGFLGAPFTRQENTVNQTCIVACYGIAFNGKKQASWPFR